MKTQKIIYWTSTSLIALMMLMSATMYFTVPEAAKGFEHFGFPDYFRIELGIAKIIGVIALILPMFPMNMKEWSYAGFGIVLISAAIAHGVVDGIQTSIMPIVMLLILYISYMNYKKINT